MIDWNELWRSPEIIHLLRVCLFVVLGLFPLYVLSYAAGRMFASRQSPHFSQLIIGIGGPQ